MSDWKMFLEFAKAHPDTVPKNAKSRAALYKRLKDECKCGMTRNALCTMMGITAITRKLSVNNDATFLKAKIQALEEQLAERDAELKSLKTVKQRVTL